MSYTGTFTLAVATEFEGLGGTGRTVEYATPENAPALLAYLDYNRNRTMAAVVVANPATGKQRVYSTRPAYNARAIVMRHLHGLGYAMPETARLIDK